MKVRVIAPWDLLFEGKWKSTCLPERGDIIYVTVCDCRDDMRVVVESRSYVIEDNTWELRVDIDDRKATNSTTAKV